LHRRDAREYPPHSLNTASAVDLEQTHMIDGGRARRLIDYPERHGRFSSSDEVKKMTGFEDGLVERLQERGFGLE